MKLIDMKVATFIDEVDDKSPAPGGGSVAALCASLGVSLTRMVGHLTTSKKKFQTMDPKIQLEFSDVMDALLMIKDQLMLLIDRDTEAFTMIMEAYRMPKETKDDLNRRSQEIRNATEQAILVPIKVASLSLAALHHLPFMLQYGNRSAISDLGVATLALATGIDGACMNVLINLPGLENEIADKQYRLQVDTLSAEAHQIRDRVLDLVYQSLKKETG